LAKLEDLSTKLWEGDHRLIQSSPTEETTTQQQTICPNIIPSLVQTVAAAAAAVQQVDNLSTRGAAAAVLHLCTTDHPENRAAIGAVENGIIHAGLTKLVNDKMQIYNNNNNSDKSITEKKKIKATSVVANAAKAIWILVYNNEKNHKGFFDSGAVEALVNVVNHYKTDDKDASEYAQSSICYKAVMWSLAALQNLGASDPFHSAGGMDEISSGKIITPCQGRICTNFETSRLSRTCL